MRREWSVALAIAALAIVLGFAAPAYFSAENLRDLFLVNMPVVVTLAAMVALRDALRWATQGAWVENLPARFQWLGVTQSSFPIATACGGAMLLLAIGWSLRNVPAGRAVYATGSNAEAARLAG